MKFPVRTSVKRIYLNFHGYWKESGIKALPDMPGVYCVYKSVFDPSSRTVAPAAVIHIGETISIRNAVSSQANLGRWKTHLAEGEELCFSFASIILDRKRAASALLLHHTPLEFTAEDADLVIEHITGPTEVVLSGRIALLAHHFTVNLPGMDYMDLLGLSNSLPREKSA